MMLSTAESVFAPKSISGSPLHGDKLVRLTYFDDCGLFNARQEPVIVVAGILVDADRQMIAVEERLARLADETFNGNVPKGFFFHAKDLWHGEKFFPREKWDLPTRLKILGQVAQIAIDFELPITFGFQRREFEYRYGFGNDVPLKVREITMLIDIVARFCESVEMFMRECFPDEVTIIFGEDRDSVREALKEAHLIYRDPIEMKKRNPSLTYFPFHHIRDGLHFSKKTESAHLQIADACAFIIKRHIMRDEHVFQLYSQIAPMMIGHPNLE